MLKVLLRQSLILGSVFLVGVGFAQSPDTYPSKTIKFVVSFTAGGTTDILAREVAQQMTLRWKVPVVVENKPGASGNLGTELVGKSPADGYTILVNSFGPITINPTLFKNLPVDPQKDLQPVALLADVPTVLVVPGNVGHKDFKDFVAYAQAKGDKTNYGSTGIGTAAHMTAFLFSKQSKLNATHIPYKGAEATRDLVAGRLDYMFATVPSVVPLIKGGQLKALAVSTKARSRALPDLPSLQELGVDMATGSWFGMFVPKNTPPDIVRKLNETVVSILEEPQLKARLVAQGAEPIPMNVAEFTKFLKADFDTWTPVVKESGAKAE